MHKILLAASAVFLATAWLASRSLEVRAFLSTESLPTRAEEGVGSQIVVRAQELLASLDAEGRRAATFDYGDKERFNWHFIPRERKGIPLNQLSEDQKKKAKTLLSASLSELGVQKADQVRELEGILRDIEGPNRRFSRDPEEYFVSVFGEPATEGRWGWRFEGHHLALNFSLDGARLLSATPLLYGANPAIVEKGPKKGLRVLASLEDVARELVTSLDDEQKKAALGEKTEEVKATRSATYNEALPSGVSWGKLSEKQRQLLRKLV
ncbi:MAG: DUF3500 domain-containing protein, partial [Planctomycetota bacterium]|nr:DUF3500 domain-containing protein [Planctomycetota bacterium]